MESASRLSLDLGCRFSILYMTSCYCPFKYLRLGGGEGEQAEPGPRLSLQHPPHDLMLHTPHIEDHLPRIRRYSKKIRRRRTINRYSIKRKDNIEMGHRMRGEGEKGTGKGNLDNIRR